MEKRGYVICATPRSGSNYLCDLLLSTRAMGWPFEYFNTPLARRVIDPGYPADMAAQLVEIDRRAATGNGVYGLKAFAHTLELAAQTDWPAKLPGLAFVHLERRDLLGQAISLARANQTGQWTSLRPASGQASYAAGEISGLLDQLAIEGAAWRRFFARRGIQPLFLAYEDVVADPQGAVGAVAGLVGLQAEPAIDPALTKLQVQRDAVNVAWRAKFLAAPPDMGAFRWSVAGRE